MTLKRVKQSHYQKSRVTAFCFFIQSRPTASIISYLLRLQARVKSISAQLSFMSRRLSTISVFLRPLYQTLSVSLSIFVLSIKLWLYLCLSSSSLSNSVSFTVFLRPLYQILSVSPSLHLSSPILSMKVRLWVAAYVQKQDR